MGALTLLSGTASTGSPYLSDGLLYDELWKYSTATMTWTQLDAGAGVMGTAPSPRYGPGMAAVGEDLYVFGGEDISGEAGGKEGQIGHAWLLCCVRH